MGEEMKNETIGKLFVAGVVYTILECVWQWLGVRGLIGAFALVFAFAERQTGD